MSFIRHVRARKLTIPSIFKPIPQLATPPPESPTKQVNGSSSRSVPSLSPFAAMLLKKTKVQFSRKCLCRLAVPPPNKTSIQRQCKGSTSKFHLLTTRYIAAAATRHTPNSRTQQRRLLPERCTSTLVKRTITGAKQYLSALRSSGSDQTCGRQTGGISAF